MFTHLGGIWSSMAAHLVYFVFQSFRNPFMVFFTLVTFPVSMTLNLGVLNEEPNNHLVVARKPKSQ